MYRAGDPRNGRDGAKHVACSDVKLYLPKISAEMADVVMANNNNISQARASSWR